MNKNPRLHIELMEHSVQVTARKLGEQYSNDVVALALLHVKGCLGSIVGMSQQNNVDAKHVLGCYFELMRSLDECADQLAAPEDN
jgi:hypothetical protein